MADELVRHDVVHPEAGVGAVPDDGDLVPGPVTEAPVPVPGGHTDHLGAVASVEPELDHALGEGEVEEVAGLGELGV